VAPVVTELLAVAEELYGLPLAEFTAARDARARELKGKPLAAPVKALRKPSTAAWVVDLLVRRENDQVAQMLEVGQALRAAQDGMDAAALRELTRQRRKLTAALTVRATGVGSVDVATAVALPDALGFAAAAVADPPVSLHVVPEPEPDRRALEEAQAALAEAESEAARAEEERARAAAEVDRLEARALQVQAELDELRRRLAELEQAAQEVDDELADAEDARAEAESAAAAAVRRRNEAAELESRLRHR
jgi:DNA repair exonuclease SbcCD ATPase subunit